MITEFFVTRNCVSHQIKIASTTYTSVVNWKKEGRVKAARSPYQLMSGWGPPSAQRGGESQAWRIRGGGSTRTRTWLHKTNTAFRGLEIDRKKNEKPQSTTHTKQTLPKNSLVNKGVLLWSTQKEIFRKLLTQKRRPNWTPSGFQVVELWREMRSMYLYHMFTRMCVFLACILQSHLSIIVLFGRQVMNAKQNALDTNPISTPSNSSISQHHWTDLQIIIPASRMIVKIQLFSMSQKSLCRRISWTGVDLLREIATPKVQVFSKSLHRFCHCTYRLTVNHCRRTCTVKESQRRIQELPATYSVCLWLPHHL